MIHNCLILLRIGFNPVDIYKLRSHTGTSLCAIAYSKSFVITWLGNCQNITHTEVTGFLIPQVAKVFFNLGLYLRPYVKVSSFVNFSISNRFLSRCNLESKATVKSFPGSLTSIQNILIFINLWYKYSIHLSFGIMIPKTSILCLLSSYNLLVFVCSTVWF